MSDDASPESALERRRTDDVQRKEDAGTARHKAHGLDKWQVAIAVGLFIVTVVLALHYHWDARDLVWASWISGVVVGLGLFGLSLASFSLIPQRSLGSGCAWVLLIFFFPVWAAFQFGLAAVLHGLFPLAREKFDLFFFSVLQTTLASYWPFVVMSMAGELNGLRSYWRLAGKMSKQGQYPVLIYGPFASAGRMFLIVFCFACLNWSGLRGYFLYPALIFYFFPWNAVPWKAIFGHHQGRQPSTDPDRWVIRYGGGRFSVAGVPVLFMGLWVFSLVFWSESLRNEWWQVRVFVVLAGLVLSLIGVALVFGRIETIIDRRERAYTEWLGLGSFGQRTKHELPAAVSVQIERTIQGGVKVWLAGTRETLELTPRDGVVRYNYEVQIKAGKEKLHVDSFDDPEKAEQLAEELSAFLRDQG